MIQRVMGWCRAVLLTAASVVLPMTALAAEPKLDFNRDIRPILSHNCFFCHGQDGSHREANLRLDEASGATQDLGHGRSAIVPGKPEASELIKRVFSSNEEEVMPPPSSHKKLTAAQRELLKRWIAEGAEYEKHWAFIPPKKVPLQGTVEPIDQLVEARLKQVGLSWSAAAAPEIWLRRVTLDLTGLPPTPAEVTQFTEAVSKSGESAYVEVVDRLLASPRYGERMAHEWLDAARYADTHGFNNDSARTMWRWRDWVIDAFNDNLPYHRFITEQLAGDLLPSPTLEQRIATGFCRNHVINSEGGIIDEEYRVEYVADRVRTMSTAWLGLTMECCRCHNHKFDPLTTKDYYSLYAFFNNVPEHGEDGRIANAAPLISAPTREQQRQVTAQRAALAEIDQRLDAVRAGWNRGQALSAEQVPGNLSTAPIVRLAFDDNQPVEGLWRWAGAGPRVVPGVLGQACGASEAGPLGEVAAGKVNFAKRLTVLFWINPAASNPRDVALISSVSYDGEPSQQGYAKGQELRLIDGELEVRLNDYFPAYAMRLRSVGAAIQPGQWRQIGLIAGQSAKAQDVRLFVDGQELATETIYDGVPSSGWLGAPALRLGADFSKNATAFAGEFDEFNVFEAVLSPADIDTQFHSQALPLALRELNAGTITPLMEGWLRDGSLAVRDGGFAQLRQQRRGAWEQHLEFARTFPTAMVMQELPRPRETHVLVRGVYNAPGEQVSAMVPEAVLARWPAGAPHNRLGLAQWFTSPEHPLTARVVVNRVWAQLFGAGIVRTLEDFGSQGEFPTHPELLDWLARDFVDQGWDMKRLVRRLVLSRTYRQSSSVSAEQLRIDPENRFLGRASRPRLAAEVLRDQALALGGLLKERVGGPSVFPYQPDGLYNGLVVGADYPGTKWVPSQGDDLFRRSLYTFWKRTVPHPVMLTFDAPDREFCLVRRARTNTPLQALVLLNEPAFVEAAQHLGRRMQQEGGADDASRIRWGFRTVTARPPTPAELEVLNAALQQARSENAETAYSILASLLLNLDETVSRE